MICVLIVLLVLCVLQVIHLLVLLIDAKQSLFFLHVHIMFVYLCPFS